VRLVKTRRFVADYEALPAQLRKRTDQKLRYLAENIAHPSLRVKRVRRYEGLLEGSVNMSYRFVFQIEGDAYILLRVGKHDILDKA
jgi:mRNA-degrading endonuclease RelE of RelBE toxin-antitoxin system